MCNNFLAKSKKYIQIKYWGDFMLKKLFAIGLAAGLAAASTLPAAAERLSNELQRWYFKNRPAEEQIDLAKYNAYYLGDTSRKEIYLTFDEGYENGHTAQILDVLKEKGVPAAFFVTKTYITAHPDLIKRMVDEGHIVANHTVRHKCSPTLSDEEMRDELFKTAAAYKELIGADMPPFFRPPMGQYSERVLKITQDCGYNTIFWSFAYMDWEVDRQPGRDAAHKKVVGGAHNGAILLLHAVSKSNAQAMGDIIDSLQAQGYEFKSLYDLPNIIGGGIL